MTPIVFIDTETTGIHPGRKVWEVAMIRRDEDGDTETAFFVDVDLTDADPFGLNVGRFWERHPRGRWLSGRTGELRMLDSWTPLDAAIVVSQKTHGAHLVGAVPNFDAETLAPLLREHNLIPSWHYHLVDVEALAVGYLEGQAEAGRQEVDESITSGVALPWNSNDLSRAVGVDPEGFDRHTALGDAKWARAIYDAVTWTGDA